MTIAQLEGLLSSRRNRLNTLTRQRRRAQRKLDAIDRQIASLNGRGMGGNGMGGRARNSQSLSATMESILQRSGKPMKVGDIVDAVLRTGYRTTSDNFRSIVNQTLIKEKGFSSAGRGVYQLKK
jgi:hypothetical protein